MELIGEPDNVKRKLAWLEGGAGREVSEDGAGWWTGREHGELLARRQELGDLMDALEGWHKIRPRPGAELRRHDILTGYWGRGEPPMRHHYPMLALLGCTGCGKTIRCQSPEEPWEHVEW